MARGKDRLQADLLLLLAALVWGGGFVAQRYATQYLSMFAFNGLRFLLAGMLLLPAGLRYMGNNRRSLLWLLPAGLLLFGGSALQQAGLKTTTAGSAGFITGVYVVLVPLFLALIWHVHIPMLNWLAAAAALAGTYLLSTSGQGLRPSRGDLLELLGAVVWSFHVIVVGIAVQKVNIYTFSAGQFLLCGGLSLIFSEIFTPLSWESVLPAWAAILYGGILSVAVGFTLQAVGQKHAPASDAALILSLESVFAAVFGALILSERMDAVQILGCIIIMTAIISVQILSLRKAGIPEKKPEAQSRSQV